MKSSLRKLVISHHSEIIHIISETAAHHAIRLKRLHELIQLTALRRLQRAHIEPELRHWSITCQKLADLSLAELMMLGSDKICIMARNRICMRIIPVYQRKIQTEIQPMPLTGLRYLTHIITAGRCHPDTVISCRLSIKHAESIMMLGSKHYRTHAGLLCQKSYLIRIEVHWIEFIRGFSIPIRKDACK